MGRASLLRRPRLAAASCTHGCRSVICVHLDHRFGSRLCDIQEKDFVAGILVAFSRARLCSHCKRVSAASVIFDDSAVGYCCCSSRYLRYYVVPLCSSVAWKFLDALSALESQYSAQY